MLDRRHKSWSRPIFVSVSLLFVAYLVWEIGFPHRDYTSGPVPLAEANGCPIPLPGSARNIQFYKWRQWNLFVEYVRFEASPQECLGHMQKVLEHWRSVFSAPDYPDHEPPKDIEETPTEALGEQFDVTWFDVQNIRKGKIAGGGGSGVPMIWVDTERGVFYYRLTD
ncbi:MAG: hypothetical protein SVV80_11765 [Planctomycetota bacterium]|nr:hypothetical protein [Planctomycetota bacterium]